MAKPTQTTTPEQVPNLRTRSTGTVHKAVDGGPACPARPRTSAESGALVETGDAVTCRSCLKLVPAEPVAVEAPAERPPFKLTLIEGGDEPVVRVDELPRELSIEDAKRLSVQIFHVAFTAGDTTEKETPAVAPEPPEQAKAVPFVEPYWLTRPLSPEGARLCQPWCTDHLDDTRPPLAPHVDDQLCVHHVVSPAYDEVRFSWTDAEGPMVNLYETREELTLAEAEELARDILAFVDKAVRGLADTAPVAAVAA